SDIILKGERVVHLDEFVTEAPFRRARVTPEPDCPGFASGAAADERLNEIRTLLDRACPGAMARLESCLVNDPEEDGGLELMHMLAMHLPVDREKKLEWLRVGGALQRWQAIRSTLCQLAAGRELRHRVMLRYDDLRPDRPGHN
ncbi:MAG: hypothetical protein KC591_17875, partial [Gemmatimonadetes bacterium]|nr:hypothetical protein [Gemmatimonadota bacterium]